ncbi:MAG TPA: cob(I)yrinic acid a,c-diamide adenosyltransferase [Fibrobacteraceae bacterium]|nr:cob(I)yrinic acid a,c-diamide adenosyltransferase [Fibrobacteraceae bacterium]
MHLTRIYTRAGDKGLTSLASGERVPKNHPRLETYGTSDELNCVLGHLRTQLHGDSLNRTGALIAMLQDRLFDLGTRLATTPGKEWPNMPGLRQEDVDQLEKWIDEFNAELPPLRSFVLPGASLCNADAHLARTVCRRLERQLCSFAETEELSPVLAAWVNRLSDLLFVLARWYAHTDGLEEPLWTQRPA